MSIRSVSCPGCNASLNVPSTMTNIKCSACGTIWNVANPAAAKIPATARAKRANDPEDGASDDAQSAAQSRNPTSSTTMIAITGAALALLVLLGVGIAMISGGGGDTQKTDPATTEATAQAQPSQQTKIQYEIVKLPESQRKKIYFQYRQTAGSTVEKKVFLPSSSKAREGIGNTMNALVKREVTHLSLIHNVKEEDIYNIVLEGDDKQWPPKRKPAPVTP